MSGGRWKPEIARVVQDMAFRCTGKAVRALRIGQSKVATHKKWVSRSISASQQLCGSMTYGWVPGPSRARCGMLEQEIPHNF